MICAPSSQIFSLACAPPLPAWRVRASEILRSLRAKPRIHAAKRTNQTPFRWCTHRRAATPDGLPSGAACSPAPSVFGPFLGDLLDAGNYARSYATKQARNDAIQATFFRHADAGFSRE